MRSFERVTGPKTEDWVAKTLGVVIAVAGAALAAAGQRRKVTPELALIAAGTAATLAGADVIYVSRRRIPPVYLLDAAAELALIGAWAVAWAAGS